MFYSFIQLHPAYQALIAGCFTFFVTVLGAAIVLFFQKVNETFMNGMMGLSAGIMIAASVFSLLNPAIEMADLLQLNTWLVIFCGFLGGGILLIIGNKSFDLLSFNSHFKRSVMLFLSITLHNIPEGLILGVAFGSVLFSPNQETAVISAIILTVGIAIQNFPEGCAISLPLRRDGVSLKKAFFFGGISAIVEPIFAVIGAILVLKVQQILPFVMSFTAGAMMFVVIEELIPEIMQNKRKDLMSLLIMLGFGIMMILEITLG